jgi:hypothetical protein
MYVQYHPYLDKPKRTVYILVTFFSLTPSVEKLQNSAIPQNIFQQYNFTSFFAKNATVYDFLLNLYM